MADDVTLPGTGAVVATDDVSGRQFQVVKLDGGANGVSAPLTGDTTNGLKVDVTRQLHGVSSAQTATWTSATSADTTVELDTTGYATVLASFVGNGGTCSAGRIRFEAWDGANWSLVVATTAGDGFYDRVNTSDFGGAARTNFVAFRLAGHTKFRLRLQIAITGTLSLAVRIFASTAEIGTEQLYGQSSGTGVPTLLRVDDLGNVQVVGPDAAGDSPSQAPVTVAGSDGSAVRRLLTNASGALAVQDNGGNLSIDDGGNSITVDGTVAVSGTVAVTDNSGSLTVDAPVATPVFVRLSDGASAITALPVTDNAGSLTVDNGGTFVVQDSQALTDNGGFTDNSSKVFPVGYVFDEVAGTSLTENDVAAGRIDSKRAQVGVIEDATTRGQRAAVSAAGRLSVDASGVAVPVTDNSSSLSVDDNGGSLTVDNGGTFVVQDSQALTDNGSFTDNSSKVFPVGYVFDEVAGTSLTENDVAAGRIDAKRAQVGVLEDATTRGQRAAVSAAGRLSVDASGVAVPVTDNSGSLTVDNGGTFVVQDSEKLADNAQFTDGTTKVLPVGYVFDDVAGTALTENDVAAARIDSKRAQVTTIEDPSTRGRGATVTASNALKVDGSAVTQPVSGTVTASNSAGDVAHGTTDGGNPVKIGLKAANAFPTAESNGDRVNGVGDLWGRQLTAHIDPAMFVSKSFNATTQQTGADVWTPASGKKIAVTSVVIGTYGTTAGRVILWFGDNADTTYTAGTDQLLLAFSTAPSSTSKPGLVFTPASPVFCTTADRELHITTDTGVSIDVAVHGYEW